MTSKILKTGILSIILLFGLMTAGCDFDDGRTVTGVVATLMEGTSSSRDSIHITWNGASAATRYEVTYRTHMDSHDTRRTVPSSNNITITTYTHSNYLRDQGSLTYYVRAHGTSTDAYDGKEYKWTGEWAVSNEVVVRQ